LRKDGKITKFTNWAAIFYLPITAVGVSFSAKTKGVADWDKEEL
jgi:hypothetical protein